MPARSAGFSGPVSGDVGSDRIVNILLSPFEQGVRMAAQW
jgi:hypothetical protein